MNRRGGRRVIVARDGGIIQHSGDSARMTPEILALERSRRFHLGSFRAIVKACGCTAFAWHKIVLKAELKAKENRDEIAGTVLS